MKLALKIALFTLFALPFFAFAQNPSVTTFVVSPASIASGDVASFAWQLQEAGGYSFIIPCYTGIKFKYFSGSAFSCGNKISTTAKVNDLLTFYVYNTSGFSRVITATLTPKNASGQDYGAGSKDATLAVAALAQPIIKFSASPETTLPEKPAVLSWQSAAGVDGVNLQIECKEGIRVTSASFTGTMPCGKPVFTSDLAPSGTLALNFYNSLTEAVPLQFTLLPAISPKSYDATHAANITVTIASDILPDPEVTYFAASTTLANYGEPVTLNWATTNAKGANISIFCVESVSATSSKNPSSILPCDKLAFSDSLTANGNLKLYFQNKSQTNQAVNISLFPSKTAGTYDATRGKSITIVIKPPAAAATAPITPPVIPPVAPPAPMPTTLPAPAAKQTSPTPSAKTIIPSPPAPLPISPIQKIQTELPKTEDVKIKPLVIKTESEISQKLLENKNFVSITDIKPAFNNHFYEVKVEKRARILFLIPAKMEVELFINAETGEVISEKTPWWAFLII
ncbi:MAG: hypothetical protein Q8Q46_00930 [Candidatus Giovannonibacteria bacterium]|nr:hypothetical protein [Candidatus Giovannonibacteria bacterium]